MKVQDAVLSLLALFSLLLLVVVVSLLVYVNDLEEQYDALSADYNQLLLEKLQLEDSLYQLQERYLSCRNEVNILRGEISELEGRLEDVKNWLNKYSCAIDEILQWLGINSEMNEDMFEGEVSGCLEGRTVNYPCIILLRKDYKYVEENGDRLSSVEEFIRRKGGDCEDFALYAAALVKKVMENGYLVKFFKKGKGRFWLSSRWYLPDAEPVTISPRSVRVICGREEENDPFEHCIIQVCDDVCIYVEPQSGEIIPDPFVEITVTIEANDINWYGVDLLEAKEDVPALR